MENRERKKKNRVMIGGGGGDIGAVVLWGGAMAVAGVVAAFAVKRRCGWGRKDSKAKEEEEIKKNEEKEKAKVIDSMLNVKKIDSVDLVSALLGEKPKDDSAKQRPTAPHQDIVPIINYAIPAIPTHPEIIHPLTTLNPDIQEIIPFAKLKPEFIAGIVEECKSLVIDKVDPPAPLKDAKGPVERLILKPIISQATLEAEPLLSPIKEVEEPGDNEGGEGKEEIEEENEDEGEEEFIEEASGESSSAFNDEAIWPAEMIEELSRELKEMKIDLESHEEEGVIGIERKHEIVDETKRNRDVGNDEEEKVVPVATTQMAKLARSRTWVLLLSGFNMLLLLVLIFRFDAMSRVFRQT